MAHSRWNLLPPLPGDSPLRTSRISPLFAQLLYNRGIAEPSQVEVFLSAGSELAGDPLRLPGMHQAVARLYQALLRGEKIAVYGDFDVDGISATALLVQGLTAVNGQATPYIPHRLTEGYGLNTTALENLAHNGFSLVVTVDCGITGVPEVKKARRLGLDVVVTDHHTPLETIPAAVAVVDPKLPGSQYPFTGLSGAGVAFKLLQALYQGLGREANLEEVMDLVALGTVADIVPLLGENRYLVREGLGRLRSSPRLGIREIASRAGLDVATLDSDSISWTIAPRLNAAGRLEHAMSSYRLLTTDSPDEARELAGWLEEKNAERQKLTAKVLDEARKQVEAQGQESLLIATGNEYPAGILGLVASRLADEFYRPAVVIRTGEEICSGSCRSIPDFDIIRALTECGAIFTHYGGHAQAAGFSLPPRNLPHLQDTLRRVATERLAGLDLRPRLDIEAEITLAELYGNTFPTIQKLAPFGHGNPQPVFLSRGVSVLDCRKMGNNGDHLRLKLRQGNAVWDAVGFGLGSYAKGPLAPIDMVFTMDIDRWGGREQLRLNILDFAPAAAR